MATVRDRVKREPDIFLRLAQNSMVVAASLREKFDQIFKVEENENSDPNVSKYNLSTH